MTDKPLEKIILLTPIQEKKLLGEYTYVQNQLDSKGINRKVHRHNPCGKYVYNRMDHYIECSIHPELN